MEITTQTRNFIHFHRAVITTSLDAEQIVAAIAAITTTREARLKWTRYKGTYRFDTPFTGYVSEESIDLYWWKPLYPKKYLRIRGTVSAFPRVLLSLRSGSVLASIIELLAVLMAITIAVYGFFGPAAGNAADSRPLRFPVIFIAGIAWFFIASARRRNAFDAAVVTIADAITAREPDPDAAIPPDRTVSSRRA
jgi:hypothetical protein